MTALHVALAVVGAVTGSMLAAAVGFRLRGLRRARDRAWMDRTFAPAVADLCAGLRDGLADPRSRRGRALLKTAMLEAAPEVTGPAHVRLARAFVTLGFADETLAALRSRRLGRRLAAAEALGEMRLAGYSSAVQRGLRDRDSVVRAACAIAIARSGGADGMMAELVAALDVGEHAALGADVAEALSGSGPDAIEELQELLRGYPEPRTAALIAVVLGERHAIASARVLRGLLGEADDEVVARAISALGAIGDPASASIITTFIGGSRAPGVRAAACRASVHLESPDAVSALSGALGDEHWPVRRAAAETLVALGWPAVAQALSSLGACPPETTLHVWSALERADLSGDVVTRAARADPTAQRLVAGALAAGARARVEEAAAGDGPTARYARALLAGVPVTEVVAA